MAAALMLAPAAAAEPEASLVWIETPGSEIPAMLNGVGNDNAILLLHDIDSSVVEEAFIAPLRQLLPQNGWDVLAPRLPAAPPQAGQEHFRKLLSQQLQRIAASAAFLKQEGYDKIVILGHGFGAFAGLQAVRHNSKGKTTPFHAAALVNTMWYGYPDGRDEVIFGLEQSSVPVLDIGSEQAHSQVSANHQRRAAATRVLSSLAGNTYSRQVLIPLKRHNMAGAEAIATRIITNWLKGMAENEESDEQVDEQVDEQQGAEESDTQQSDEQQQAE